MYILFPVTVPPRERNDKIVVNPIISRPTFKVHEKTYYVKQAVKNLKDILPAKTKDFPAWTWAWFPFHTPETMHK